MIMVKNGDYVVPGEIIGEVSKYKAGQGTYVQDSYIRSLFMGIVKIDKQNRTINVIPLKEANFIKVGDIVIGEIFSVSNTIVNVKIYFSYHSGKIHVIDAPYSGTIHISQLGIRANNMSEYIKVGDLVIAKVILDREKPYPLTISRPELGIIAAYCSACGGEMDIKNLRENSLICKKCGKVEKRKLSKFYDFNLFTKYYKTFRPKMAEKVATLG